MKFVPLRAAALVGIAIAGASGPARAESANSIEIVIRNGPHAGTYKLPQANTLCMSLKDSKQLSAAYKDMNARDPKQMSGAGINVFDPDSAGPKRGEVNIAFGDPDRKRPPAYDIFVPRDSKGPLTVTRNGKGFNLTFDGASKDGVNIRVAAACGSPSQF